MATPKPKSRNDKAARASAERDAATMRDFAARKRAEREAREAAEVLPPCPDLSEPLTPLESLALLRCGGLRFKVGTDETGADVLRPIQDLEEIKNTIALIEHATAPPDDLGDRDREARSDRMASALITAYIWARLKQSASDGVAVDPRAMGATQSPEFRRVLRQLEREKQSGRAGIEAQKGA